MKLAYPSLSEPILLEGNGVPCLVIENKTLFRTLLCDISYAIEGNDTPLVVSKSDQPIDISKNVELLADFIHFELNKKPLLTKMIAELEKAAVSSEHYLATQELLSRIEMSIDEWAFSFPCDIVADKVSVTTLLKSAGIGLRNEYEGHRGEVEKVLDYMELVREFDRDKLFVTVNMRAFFDDEIIREFHKTVLSHEYRVLMIESQAYPLLETEMRKTVDVDLCEF